MIIQETFVRGEYIIREGTSGDSFYLLADGEVLSSLSLSSSYSSSSLSFLSIIIIFSFCLLANEEVSSSSSSSSSLSSSSWSSKIYCHHQVYCHHQQWPSTEFKLYSFSHHHMMQVPSNNQNQ